MARTDDLHRPFVPHRARPIALALGAAVLVAMLLLSIFVRTSSALDRVGYVVVGLIIGGFLYRQATVRAVPGDEGLQVRNLFLTRTVEWAEVLTVQFGDNPWVQLDLSDGTTLSVMAIQRADGIDAARAEATRLATLVELHTDPGPGRDT